MSTPTTFPDNPCTRCGACCAFFRVLFHWSESLPQSLHVPEELTEQVKPHLNAMRGTNQSNPRCEALQGEVGKSVGCGVYERRPSPCRNFKASYSNGKRNKRCDEARLAKGLKPLTRRDWPGDKPGKRSA